MYEIRENDWLEDGQTCYTLEDLSAPSISDSCMILTKDDLLKLYDDICCILKKEV